MFCVLYRFKLKPHQEVSYKKCWNVVTDYFIRHRGALGSCLHQTEDNLWIAYSRWPDKATRDASWPADGKIDNKFPSDVVDAIKLMQSFRAENKTLEQYDEIAMTLVMDKL